MPVGYLIAVVVFAAATLLALAPPIHRPRVVAKVGWLLGPTFDAPVIPGFLLAAATASGVAGGDVDSVAAWAVVGAAALTAVGLGLVARRGRRAGPVVREALREGLGPVRAEEARAAVTERPRRRPSPARVALWPFPWFPRPRAVERVKDIRYGEAGRENLLDLYRHRSHPSPAPTLVYAHGGGYFSGGKSREAMPLIQRLAGAGWVCLSIDYRLRPAASFPDHLVDLKKAIAWAREQGVEYGVDPGAVLVAGSSAGGHMAALAALTANDPALQPGFEDADTSVSAAISLYGYLGNYYGMGAGSSPGAHVSAAAPPFFLAQGDHDTYSPRFLEISREFARRLRGASEHPVVYAELPGAQHSFDLFHSGRFEATVDGIEEFAAAVLPNRTPEPGTVSDASGAVRGKGVSG